MRRIGLTLLLSFVVPLSLCAQAPFLVKDINLTRNGSPRTSRPQHFFRYGSGVVFVANTSVFSLDNELWITDGTEAGTSQVSNINPGSVWEFPRFAIVNGTLIFNARDSRGEELWMSDGTTAGTRLMADINSGASSSRPGGRIVHRGRMIFSADDGISGPELWTTDGTPAGTRFLKDLKPGWQGSEPSFFVLFRDQVCFLAAGALWKTDGTDSGTVLVKSLLDARDLTVAGSHMFFNGYSSQTGAEPWVSDGTEAGTHMLADIAPGPEPSVHFDMVPFGDRVLFLAGDQEHGFEPWISDGTTAGTRLVRDIIPGPDG